MHSNVFYVYFVLQILKRKISFIHMLPELRRIKERKTHLLLVSDLKIYRKMLIAIIGWLACNE